MMRRWIDANERAEAAGDWKPMAEFYTEDAEYTWNLGPNEDFVARGRQQIRDWVLGTEMEGLEGWQYPYDRVLIDDKQGEVVAFWRQVAPASRPDGSALRDPRRRRVVVPLRRRLPLGMAARFLRLRQRDGALHGAHPGGTIEPGDAEAHRARDGRRADARAREARGLAWTFQRNPFLSVAQAPRSHPVPTPAVAAVQVATGGYWFSRNPSKAWAEKFFLLYSLYWMLGMGVLMRSGAGARWGDLALNLAMLVLFAPLARRTRAPARRVEPRPALVADLLAQDEPLDRHLRRDRQLLRQRVLLRRPRHGLPLPAARLEFRLGAARVGRADGCR